MHSRDCACVVRLYSSERGLWPTVVEGGIPIQPQHVAACGQRHALLATTAEGNTAGVELPAVCAVACITHTEHAGHTAPPRVVVVCQGLGSTKTTTHNNKYPRSKHQTCKAQKHAQESLQERQSSVPFQN